MSGLQVPVAIVAWLLAEPSVRSWLHLAGDVMAREIVEVCAVAKVWILLCRLHYCVCELFGALTLVLTGHRFKFDTGGRASTARFQYCIYCTSEWSDFAVGAMVNCAESL